MKKSLHNVRLNSGKSAILIACFAVSTIFASFGNEPELTDDDGIEFTIFVSGKWTWTPFRGRTGVTFTNSDTIVLSIEDNGTRVRFTGKQVGKSTITATLGNQTLKAFVRVRAVEGGEKYSIYYKPVTAFNIEYNRFANYNH